MVDLARHDGAAVALGERDHADRQRGPADDVGLRRSATHAVGPVEPHHFRRPAADIKQDDTGSGRIEQLGAAGCGQSRFGRRVHDLKFEAGLLGDAGAKLVAVLGGAAGLGGDQSCAMHAAGAHFIAADQKRLDGAFDRGLADPARRRDPLPQADDAGEGVDDAKAVGRRARDQKPAIVGAEIERRVGSIDQCVARGPVILAMKGRRGAHHRASAAANVAGTPGDRQARRRAEPPGPFNAFPPRRSFRRSTAAGHVQAQFAANVSAGGREGQYCAFCAGVPCPAASLSRWTKSTISMAAC